jgi:alpha-ketoglutarate-dependent taurine dioxygenase
MEFFKEVSYEKGVASRVRDLLETTKIVLLTGRIEGDPFDFYDRLSDEIGEWVPMDEDLTTEKKTGAKWIEIKYDPQFPDSYRHSSTRQPLHTDGSYESRAPQVSFFYCIEAAGVGGATTFADSDDLLKALELYSKPLLRDCYDIPVTFAKGEDSKTRPIITSDSKGTVLTWNYFRVMETSPEITDLRRRFHRFLEEKVVEGGLCFPCQLRPGDAVFFNDERLLHGRNAFIANRLGERCLLKGGLRLGKRIGGAEPNPENARSGEEAAGIGRRL